MKEKRKKMKVKSVSYKGKETVYDFETISHSYLLSNGIISHNSLDLYDPLSIPGGRGLFFASSTVILGTSKAKSKDGDEVNGIIVTARTKKSRFCQENTKIKYLIKYDGGIHPTWGIDDDLFEFGFLLKPAMGWYQRDFAKLGLEGEDRKWRAKDMLEYWQEFYKPILNCPYVKKAFDEKYTF